MIRLTFLGTGAALPSVERNVTALMLEREGVPWMFDCGEGTQRQMMRHGVGFTVGDIFFTHYHADHTLGLPGLLRTMGLQDRTAPLRLHGPPGAERHLGALVTLGMERPKFPVEIREIRPGDVLEHGDHALHVGEARHKGVALCFALVEHPRLGRFDPERARALGIPEGPLWGQIHRGQPVTLADGRTVTPGELVGPTRPGRRVTLSGDTAPCDGVRTLATGADLLVHEATFGEDERVRAAETRHTTARQAAELARDAGARELVLTHISARYSREAPELVAEARAVFPATRVARDGLVVEVPYPAE
ncbi:MAG TPA: ribonuclease Z [Gemmatimonadales bacterium]|nr:ribonuclease Z [Gemmatimonadales bacterium]